MTDNTEHHVAITADSDEDGLRLDKLLSSVPEIGSRAAAQKLIAGGRVTVNGEPRGKNHKVSAGEEIEAQIPMPAEFDLSPEEMELSVPYEDEYLLVVDKPAGVVTHPAKGHDHGTLVNGLLGRQIAGGEHPHRPGIVHRLDKDTSGLLIVARDDRTHRRIVEMLSRHEIERTYICLVHGLFAASEGTVEAPVGRDSRERQKMAVAKKGGREAVTHFKVIKSWSGPTGRAGGKAAASGFSLLEVKLETGRTHQIRVHLAAIGHPVAGDGVYGQRRDVLQAGRQFLHAARLVFEHPVTGGKIDVSSPLPSDLEVALSHLGAR